MKTGGGNRFAALLAAFGLSISVDVELLQRQQAGRKGSGILVVHSILNARVVQQHAAPAQRAPLPGGIRARGVHSLFSVSFLLAWGRNLVAAACSHALAAAQRGATAGIACAGGGRSGSGMATCQQRGVDGPDVSVFSSCSMALCHTCMLMPCTLCRRV